MEVYNIITDFLNDFGEKQLDLYDAIFARKTVERFRNDKIKAEDLEKIRNNYNNIQGLFDSIRTEMILLDNTEGKHVRGGLLGRAAPYYLVFYTEKAPRNLMNIGSLMQQMALYICTRGYGSGYVTKLRIPEKLKKRGNLEYAGMLEFGYAKGDYIRNKAEVDRLPMNELCIISEQPRQWVRQLLEAARYAPSYLNDQPWRFLVNSDRIHILSKKHKSEQMIKWTEKNLGILFANIMVAAEVLWVDVDFIRLDDFSQKKIPHAEYILSAILKEQNKY